MKKIHHLFYRAAAISLIVPLLGLLTMTRAFATDTSTTATFMPSADAYVTSANPSTNYGTSTSLRADSSPDTRSFLRFSVSGLNGATVTAAKLRLYAKSSSSSGLTAKTVSSNSWSETGITYSNMPSVGSSLGTSSAVSSGSWVSIGVSSYVQSEGTYSFAVTTSGSTAIAMASRESGSTAPQLVLTLGSSTAATATPTSSTSSGSIKHVFLILMENKSYSQVWSTSSTPYITSLGKSYARATAYHAITHPSLPNYLDIFAGSNYGITTDCNPSSSCHANAKNIGDSLEAKGLKWKAYEESMPSPCYLTTSGNYAPKHNPPVYFDDIRTNTTRCDSHDVTFSSLSNDLGSASTTPNYAFITPNLCDDMHSCSISTGDSWLKSHVPTILNSPACTSDTCLVVITWDEDDSSSGNHVLTIFAGSGAKTSGATSSKSYNHYSLLRTVEYIFGLPSLTSNDGNATPMTDLLR